MREAVQVVRHERLVAVRPGVGHVLRERERARAHDLLSVGNQRGRRTAQRQDYWADRGSFGGVFFTKFDRTVTMRRFMNTQTL